MKHTDLQCALDLRREDLDPELFAAAVAVQYIRRLVATGGNGPYRLDEESLSPHYLGDFLARAVETAHRTRRFEQEWGQLHQSMPQIQAAWERGQALFQEDLAHAMTNPEEMEYLSMSDFAEDCYAAVDARKTYPHDRVLQAWVTSGYMLAWRHHFPSEEDASV